MAGRPGVSVISAPCWRPKSATASSPPAPGSSRPSKGAPRPGAQPMPEGRQENLRARIEQDTGQLRLILISNIDQRRANAPMREPTNRPPQRFERANLAAYERVARGRILVRQVGHRGDRADHAFSRGSPAHMTPSKSRARGESALALMRCTAVSRPITALRCDEVSTSS